MFSILKKGGDGYVKDSLGTYHEFVCDDISDIQSLPTGNGETSYERPRPGSTCVVTGAKSVYVLSNERAWVPLV